MAHLKKRNGHLSRVGPAGSGHLVRACKTADPCDLCGDGQADYTSVVVTVNVPTPDCDDVNGTFGFESVNFCAPFEPRIRDSVRCIIATGPNAGQTIIYSWEFTPSGGILTYQEYLYFLPYPTTSPLDEVYNTSYDLCPFTANTYTVVSRYGTGEITIEFS